MKLGLGTVQFGLSYGVTNASGQVPEATAARMLGVARRRGVDLLDTAAAYGNSEAVLGRVLDREQTGQFTAVPRGKRRAGFQVVSSHAGILRVLDRTVN